jgi:hypothetical protein
VIIQKGAGVLAVASARRSLGKKRIVQINLSMVAQRKTEVAM